MPARTMLNLQQRLLLTAVEREALTGKRMTLRVFIY